MENKLIKILAIDDNNDNLITIKALIMEAFPDVKVLTALSGEKGIELALKEIPDVILLDVVMPNMDGFQVCEKLKQNKTLSDIPVVFVTALKTDKQSRIKALEVGADGFLSKPIDESELMAQVKAMLKISSGNIHKHDETLRLATLVAEQTQSLKHTHIATLNLLEDLKQENEARKKTQQELQESQERLTRAELASKSGNWELHLDEMMVISSVGATTLYGFGKQQASLDDIQKIALHQYREQLNMALKNLIEKDVPYDVEFKIKKADSGELIDIHSYAFYDKKRQIVFGVIHDITEQNRAKKALHDSEELYRSVLHASPDNITVTDLNGIVKMISPKGLSLIGYETENTLLGRNISEFLLPEHREKASTNLVDMFQGVYNGPEEYTLIKADKSTVDTEINAEFVRDINGNPTGFVFAIRDVTERKLAQNTIQESERKYRLITEKITDVVWMMDLNGKSTFVSQSVENFTGFSVDEYLNQTINDRFTPESAAIASQLFRDEVLMYDSVNIIKKDFKKILELDYRCKDGNVKTGELLITPYFNENDILIGLHGVSRDITQRKQSERLIQESEEKYRSLVENSPTGIAIYQEGKFVYVNAAGLKMFGATNETYLLGKQVLSIVHPDSMKVVVERMTSVSKGAYVPPVEEKLIRFDGSVFDGEVVALGTTFNGKPAGQVIVNDITERKTAEKRLKESEVKFRDMADLLPQVVFEMKLSCEITYVNQQAKQLFGYEIEELVGQNSLIVHTDEEKERAAEGVKLKLAGISPDNKEFTMVRKNGTTFPALIFINTIEKNNLPVGIRGVIVDITEQKNSEEKLRESEEKYRFMAENTSDVLWHLNFDLTFDYLSPAIERMQGYKPEDLLGKNLFSILNNDGKKEIESVIATHQNHLKIGEVDREMQFEYETLCKNGSWLWVEVNVTLQFDENGLPTGFYGVTRDISERKKSEAVMLQIRQNYETFFNTIDDFLFVLDNNGKILHTNTTVNKRLGYTAEELIGQPILMVHPEERRDEALHIIQEVLGGSTESCPVPLKSKSEGLIPVETKVTHGMWDGLPAIFGVTKDITQLILSEEKFSKLFKLNPSAAGLSDLVTGKYIEVNQAFYTLFGFDKDEVIGRTAEELSILTNEARDAILSRVDENGLFVDVEADLVAKNGDIKHVILSAQDIVVQDNIFRFTIVNDITERKIAERELVESENRYNSFINNNIDKIFVKDENCRYLIINDAMANFFGKEKAEIYNKTDKELADKNLIYPCSSSDLRALNADGPIVIEEKLGEKVYETIKFPMKLKNNKVGVGGIMRDITERKQAEERIRYVTRLYALSSHINQAIVEIKDIDSLFNALVQLVIEYGQFRMCWIGSFDKNTSTIQPITFAGYEDGYLDGLEINPFKGVYGNGPTGKAFAEKKLVFCNDIANDEIMAPWRESALKRGYKSSFSTPIYRKGDVYRTLTLYANEVDFFKDEEQKLLSEISESISYAIDAIDSEKERISTEVALIESEAKFRELMDNSPEGITIYVDGKVAYINKEALRLMRAKDKSEMMGKTIVDFIHPDNQALVLERMKMVAMAPINAILPSVEEKYIRLDGSEVYVEIKVMPILFDGNHAIQLSGHDITDRKEAEFALEQSRTELKTIYDHAPVMMCVVDPERKIQFANEAFTLLTGIPEEIMRGGPVGGVIGCINSFDSAKGCGYGPKCTNCGLRIAMEDTFKRGIEYQNVEYHSTLVVGSKYKEVYLLGSTSLIQTNKQKQVLLCLHDITDRKMAEEALQKSEMLLRTFIDNSPFEIWARDNDSIGILENKKLTDHYGSIVGHTPESDTRIEPETRQMWEKTNKRAFAGEVVDEEYEFDVHGVKRTFQQIVFPIKMNGAITGIAGFNIDIEDRKIAEEKIHENSVKLEMAMQVANMAWWEMNLKTGDVIFGKRKTDMLGFSAERFTHYNHFMELVHPDDYEGAMKAMHDHIYGTTEKYEIEYRIMTVKGDYKWFYDIGSVSKRDSNGKPLIVSGLVLDITERKQAEVMLLESQAELKKFAAHLQNIREEERIVLAREIHDQLGQILVAVKIDMGMLKMNVLRKFGKNVSDELIKNFDGLSALIDTTIKTARRIMSDLRPEVLDMLGFIDTVNQHLKSFQERYKVTCSFINNGAGLELTSEQSVALFRIVQESLNNIAKHAKATEVVITVNHTNDKMFLLIADNGVGFDTTDKKNQDSYGLIGMKERVFLIDGSLTIISEKGKGTTIQIIIPIV